MREKNLFMCIYLANKSSLSLGLDLIIEPAMVKHNVFGATKKLLKIDHTN
jgi:hypothetical protein